MEQKWFSSVAFAVFCIMCVGDAKRIEVVSSAMKSPPSSWNACFFFLIMASYILHRTTHPLCQFHCRIRKNEFPTPLSNVNCPRGSRYVTFYEFRLFYKPRFEKYRQHCLAVLLLLLSHPNHKYTCILFLLSWLSIKEFIWTFHRILLRLYGWFYLSISSPSLPLSVCTQSSLDYYNCEEKVSAPPGTPAWLAPQMIQARV